MLALPAEALILDGAAFRSGAADLWSMVKTVGRYRNAAGKDAG
jgi:hypothetical protein